MNDVDLVRALVAYNRSVFERFERSIARRPWRAATADRGIGHGSLKDTLVHILNVQEAWLVAVAQEKWEVFDAPSRRGASIRSWREFRQYRDSVWAGTDQLLRGLTERRLRSRVKAPWMPGRYTLRDAFFQVTLEEAHHLGEVIGAYWQRDWRPPDMTWIENLPRRGRR